MCWGTLCSSDITDIEVTNAPQLSSGGPPSVPSRISVVLVDEAKAGGAPRLECPRDDQDIRSLTMLARLVGMLLLALLARLGRCPHLTVTLLARMLQGALLVRMGRCPRFTLTLLALMASMLQLALLARLGPCPRLTPVLRWDVVSFSL